MPVTTPRTVGQIPFNFPCKKGSQAGQPGKGPNGIGNTRVSNALYPFGFGLSYTTFKYSNLEISKVDDDKEISFVISLTVTNTGKYDGDEVIQLYINDEYSSVSTYEKVLRGFRRVPLKKGESKEVIFEVGLDDLALFKDHKFVTEPGLFNVLVGSSSENIKLKGSFTLSL